MTKGQLCGEHTTDYLDDSYVPVENPIEVEIERKRIQKEEQDLLYLKELGNHVRTSDVNDSASSTEVDNGGSVPFSKPESIAG